MPRRDGVLTRRNRDELLREMTDEVAGLVLRDNHQQSLAVTLEAMGGAEDLPAQAALMDAAGTGRAARPRRGRAARCGRRWRGASAPAMR